MIGQVVIAGAGEAGAHTAIALRRHGFAGGITLLGDEDALPYERPPLSKESMLADVAEPKLILVADRVSALDLAHRPGLALARIDRAARRVQLSDGSDLPYDRLVLATGAEPRRLPGLADHPNILCLRNFADLQSIRALAQPGRRIVVIGGGFIGLELAASCRQRGCEVDVIELAPQLLGRVLPGEIAEEIAALHRSNAVRLHLGVQVETVVAGADKLRVTIPDATLDADLVILGLGVLPRTALAESVGLLIDNGVAVDGLLQSSDPAILAAGDCCSFPHPLFDNRRIRIESWRNAQKQADAVARTILGETRPFDAVPWFWSDHYDHTLQVAGLPNEGSQTVAREISSKDRVWFHLDVAGRMVGATGWGQGAAVAKEVRQAEALIARRVHPRPEQLQDRDTPLKTLANAA